MENPVSILEEITRPFYEDDDYFEKTIYDFAQVGPLSPASYEFQTKSSKKSKIKHLLVKCFVPLMVYQWLHSLGARKGLLPASNPKVLGVSEDFALQCRLNVNLNDRWKFKRLSIQVDDFLIDAMIVGTPETLKKKRWVLFTNGNASYYENKLLNAGFYNLLSHLNGNALIFNYPGVGESQGRTHRSAIQKTLLAIIHFLECKEKGLGAEEIIGYGHSIGGAVQGDLIERHLFKEDIRYLFIKSRTFCTFSKVARELKGPLAGLLVRLFGWNMKPFRASKKMILPEIILQSASVNAYQELNECYQQIIHDGIIPQKSSLAYALLRKKYPMKNKKFLGIFEAHNQSLVHPELLSHHIEELLKQVYESKESLKE